MGNLKEKLTRSQYQVIYYRHQEKEEGLQVINSENISCIRKVFIDLSFYINHTDLTDKTVLRTILLFTSKIKVNNLYKAISMS